MLQSQRDDPDAGLRVWSRHTVCHTRGPSDLSTKYCVPLRVPVLTDVADGAIVSKR